MIALIIIGIVTLSALLFIVSIYNRLVGLRENAQNSFAQIDVQLERRHDLIPNLVQTAKGFMSHESDTLEAVIAARASATQVRVQVNGDSVVASFNSSGEQAIEDAFFAAHRGDKLPRPSQIPVGASLGVDNLDAALDRLSEMSDKNRIAFVEGAIAAVLTDAHTSADEAELLRAIADAVRVPMPLILPLEMPTQDTTRFAA